MRFQCPFCRGVVSAEDKQMGQDVQCGHCDEIVSVPSPRLATGSVIGDFALLEELGRGGMGVVYLAHQISLDRPAALKILQDSFANNAEFVVNFIKEARSAAKLNHPHIVQAYAVGEDEGIFYYAMEYINGDTMKDVLKREKIIPIDQAVTIIQQIAEALDCAWKEQKLIHRDIKPDNIILAKNNRAKLADLGLSRVAGDIEDENEDEIPGNGIDDDGNGYVDDVRGWDFINNDNDPNDDNSHGTHVAGIAAAEGNNEIGICGVAWNAQIMTVKVLQSSGTGNSSDFAQGIEYASDNGATVINMSLGSYGNSGTVENVLINAYINSLLVAAAGNDGLCILNECCPMCGSMYPAAYPFVLGVQCEGSFSNIDPSGPIDFIYPSPINYELRAPGVNILSTIPNGYRAYNGTSMAAPLVSGICALAKNHIDTLWTDQLWAKLIFGSENGFVNAYNTLTLDLDSIGPDLRFIEYTLTDTLPGCDGDGRADAGETIQIHFTVKNVGGYADSTWTKIRLVSLKIQLLP